MKKHNVKCALTVAAAMLAIIASQMILSRVFTWHVGEVFSKTALSALFLYTVMYPTRKMRQARRTGRNCQ